MRNKRFSQSGQGLTEYVLIGGLVAALCIGGLMSIGDSVSGVLTALIADLS